MPSPGAQDLGAPDHRHQAHACLHHVLGHGQVPARGVGGVEVEIAPEHQPALVGLAEVEVPHPVGDHVVDAGLEPLGHEGLEHMGLDRKLDPGHRGNLRRAARDDDADPARPDAPARGLDARDAPALDLDASDLALLDEVHATLAGRASVAPGHSIVARGAAARVVEPAVDGVARLLEVEIGQELAHPLLVQKLGVVALVDHGVAAPREGVALAVGVEEVDEPALGMHDVVVDLGLEPLPEVERVRVELRVARQEVVGPHDRGVAPDVAAADVSPLQHGHVGDAVLGGEVVGGREAVPAPADDHHVVALARLGVAPDGPPAAVAAQPLADHPEARIAHP